MRLVCDIHLFHEVEPHYLGALLVILAPHQRSIVLQKRRKILAMVENTAIVMQQGRLLFFKFPEVTAL